MLAKERAGARSTFMVPVLLTVFAAGLAAQQPQKSLTLDEAINLARQNNPEFLSLKNDALVADWSVREAYGALLPGASASTSFQYQASGNTRFGIFTGSDLGVSKTPQYYVSNYNLGVDYQLSGSSLLAPKSAKAARRANDARIAAADYTMTANLTRQYLAVLGAQDGVKLAQAELDRAEDNRKLADARVKVGAATPIELKQTDVEKGRAQVALLQAENLVKTSRLRLMQQIGIEEGQDVVLTTQFAVTDVPWTQDELVKIALESHPDLVSARALEQRSNAMVKQARSAYLPSLSFQAGFSGYAREAGNTNAMVTQAADAAASAKTQCEFFNAIATGKVAGYPQTCPSGVLSADARSRIISANNVFPFNYTRDPFGASVQISLPIFSGFSRELRVQQAKADAEDARYLTRSNELRLKAEVATAYLNAQTARQSVALEQRNKELAVDQLKLATERYRVGAASFLELQDANTIMARADRAYLSAVYSFHESMAALENAVGRKLK